MAYLYILYCILHANACGSMQYGELSNVTTWHSLSLYVFALIW